MGYGVIKFIHLRCRSSIGPLPSCWVVCVPKRHLAASIEGEGRKDGWQNCAFSLYGPKRTLQFRRRRENCTASRSITRSAITRASKGKNSAPSDIFAYAWLILTTHPLRPLMRFRSGNRLFSKFLSFVVVGLPSSMLS